MNCSLHTSPSHTAIPIHETAWSIIRLGAPSNPYYANISEKIYWNRMTIDMIFTSPQTVKWKLLEGSV